MQHSEKPTSFSMDPLTPETKQFIEYLHTQNYSTIVPLSSTHYAAICPFIYTTAIITGLWHDRNTLDDRWCYSNRQEATEALLIWISSNPRPLEPEGWHRHHRTGRRRPDGDATKEYINF